MIKFLKFVPIQITLFLIIGILIGNYLIIKPIHLVVVCCVIVFVLGITYFFVNREVKFAAVFFAISVFFASIVIGVSSITFQNDLNKLHHYSNIKNFNVETPIQSVLKVRKTLKSSSKYNKYEAVVLESDNKKTIGKIIVNIKIDSLKKPLQVDDEILVKTEFRKIPKRLNPYGFNYKDYLKNQQIYHQIYISSNMYLKSFNSSKTIYGLAASIRKNINEALIKNGFKDNELALINALLLGQRQTITNDLLDNYKNAGAIHILAVSGLHVGVILLLLLFLFKNIKRFKNGNLITTILIVSLLWFYAIIAGLSASVVRAVAMFTALSIGLLINKPSNIYNNLVISMFFLLLFYPYFLFEVGFQLSYLAVFSIIWLQPKLYGLWVSKYWFFRKVWQLLSVSIVAQIGILPLSLFYFHQFPGLFFVANMLIIPFLSFILIVGIVVIILSLINLLPEFLSDFYIFVLQLMNGVISWVSSFDSFIIKNISISFLFMISVYAVLVFTLKWIEKNTYKQLIFVFISILFFQSVLFFEKYKRQSAKELVIFNNRESMIAIRNGEDVDFITSKLNSNAYAYLIGTGVGKYKTVNQNKNLYHFKNESILVVDSLGLYNFTTIKPTIILLQNSPKINLNRLIQLHQPKLIIADGSNYRYIINNWEQICIKNKTPFYNTLQKGAYILKE